MQAFKAGIVLTPHLTVERRLPRRAEGSLNSGCADSHL